MNAMESEPAGTNAAVRRFRRGEAERASHGRQAISPSDERDIERLARYAIRSAFRPLVASGRVLSVAAGIESPAGSAGRRAARPEGSRSSHGQTIRTEGGIE